MTMEGYTSVVMIVVSVWMIVNALAIQTSEFSSSMIFKIVPFFLAVALGIASMIQLGWIHP